MKTEPRRLAITLIQLTVGAVLCAVAVNGILIPCRFLSSGFTGLALILSYLFPALPSVPVLFMVLNAPVFILGWRMVGRRFFSYSLVGMFLFTAALEVAHWEFPVMDRAMAALLAGIISGAGGGLILRSAGSAGGADILAVIMVERFSIRLGSTMLAFNAAILAVSAVFYSLESALYTLVFLYVTANITNLVVTGLSQRKAVMVISPKNQEIARAILGELKRGATVIPAQGAYSGRGLTMVYTVVSQRELGRIKRLIKREDPEAFMVATDTLEVMGKDIGNQPHWSG